MSIERGLSTFYSIITSSGGLTLAMFNGLLGFNNPLLYAIGIVGIVAGLYESQFVHSTLPW